VSCAHTWQPAPLAMGRYLCAACGAVGRRERGVIVSHARPRTVARPGAPVDPEDRRDSEQLGCGLGHYGVYRRATALPHEEPATLPDPRAWRQPRGAL